MPQHFDVVVVGIGPGGGRDGKVSVLELDDGSTLPGDVLTARDAPAPSNDPPCSRGSAPS